MGENTEEAELSGSLTVKELSPSFERNNGFKVTEVTEATSIIFPT